MQGLERKILYGVLGGILVYAAVAIYADFDDLLGSLDAFSWWSFAAALGLVSLNYLLRFAKWQLFLYRLKIRIPWARSLLIFLAGFAMSITPGKLGEVLKSLLLRRSDGIPIERTAPVILAERVTDLLALILLAATGVGTYQYGAAALVVTSLLILGGVCVVFVRPVAEGILNVIERLPVLGRFTPKLREAYESMRLVLAPGVLLGTTLLSVLSWGLEAVAFLLLLEGFSSTGLIDATLSSATFVYAITTILGAISFLPGGLGVTEASMISVLQIFGLVNDPSIAAAVTILARMATLWWAVVCGLVAFVVFQKIYAVLPASDEPES